MDLETFHGRAQASKAKLLSNRNFDLKIFSTLDPAEYFVTVGSESVERATGRMMRTVRINYFKLDDGKVVHRIEYHNPLDHPPER